MLPEQMSPRQLASVKDGPRNLPLKFGQIRSVTAENKLSKSLCGGASMAYMVKNWASMAYMVSKPILVFSLSLSQAEQLPNT